MFGRVTISYYNIIQKGKCFVDTLCSMSLITNVNIIDLHLDNSKVHNHMHKVQSNALTALGGTGHGTWYST